jgi:hypothetical protein
MSEILVSMTVFHTTAAVALFALMVFGAIGLVQDNRKD